MEDTQSKSQYLEHLQHFNQQKGSAVLSHDIKNDKGVLLAKKGQRLNEQNIDLMIRHKLSKPIDSYIGLEPSLNAKSLKIAFDQQLNIHDDIAKVLDSSGARPAIPGCLYHMEQYSLIYQKLTIMAHALPKYFERSLINSMLSLSLAVYSGQSKPNCIKIFFVALIENIGLLHVDPKVTDDEVPPFELWRTYHAHPLVGKELLQLVPNLPPSIIRGVAEHHERIDGTGFPAMSGETISEFVHFTGIIDELTRLKFAREPIVKTNMSDILSLLQFRRQHFPASLFAQLQSMIQQANIQKEFTIEEGEIKSFARLQLFYYSKCMIYCDIVARIADSVSSAAPTHSKSLLRLQTLSKHFIHGVFSSGMLSLSVRELIEECLQKSCIELRPDLIEIDLAHHGILDQIHEIFLFLEYTVSYEDLSQEEKDSEAFASLQACYALMSHIQAMQSTDSGWSALVQEMYNGQNELKAIIDSMK